MEQAMNSEKMIAQNIVDYLVQLGYSRNSILYDYRIERNQIVDIMVRSSETQSPWLIVEARSSQDMPDPNDSARLQYHPTVRRLQRNATTLNAKYYLLSDGHSYLFFETDDVGRPRLLQEPVRPPFYIDFSEVGPPPREIIIDVFRQLSEFLLTRKRWRASDPRVATVILSHFQALYGDARLRRTLLETDILDNDSLTQLELLRIDRGDFTSEPRLDMAFEILEQVNLADAEKRDVLSALDEVFLYRMKHSLSVSRWLADLMVRLARITRESVVLDLYSNVGNIPAAASLQHAQVESWGIVRSPESFVWSKLQQVILRNLDGSIILSDLFADDTQLMDGLPIASHVITAPVMGGRVREGVRNSILFSQGVRNTEDLYLEFALSRVKEHGTVVFLAPEGMLFGTGARARTRKLISETTSLLAVIGLESGALKPFSSIRTSILVLNKGIPSGQHQVFMSELKDFSDSSTVEVFDSRQIPEAAHLLDSFEEWTSEQTIRSADREWTVFQKELDPKSFTAARYKPSDSTTHAIERKFHQFVPVTAVTSTIKRGKRIKLDEDGNIPVVGPATIRAMRTDPDSVGSTIQENVPSKAIQLQPYDILLNNIGTHLGAAAVADELLLGAYVSQHAIVLRPDLEQIVPDYLAIALNSDYVQSQLRQRATGSVMPSLTLQRLSEVVLPFPDLQTQRRIVAEVKDKLDKLKSAESDLAKAIADFDDVVSHLGSGVGK